MSKHLFVKLGIHKGLQRMFVENVKSMKKYIIASCALETGQ